MFIELQTYQIFKWLLNPNLYLVVFLLSLVSFYRGIEPLNKKYWISTSQDYVYGMMYTLLYFPLIVIILIYLKEFTDTYIPWINLGLAAELSLPLQILVVILFDDFLSYWSHYLRHKVNFLWYFHTIHHSQERLNPFTTKRFHPLENLFDKSIVKWIPFAVIGSPLEAWVLYYLIDAAWDYFIHSNIRINLGPLKYIFVTPQYHRIHHSSEPYHFDKNFSDRFIIWDILFSTAYLKYDEYPPTGVTNSQIVHENSLKPWPLLRTHYLQLLYPFKCIANDLKNNSKLSNKNS